MAKRIITPRTPASDGKDIVRIGVGDFEMFYDGAFIGARSSYLQAESDLDQYVLDLLEAEAATSADQDAFTAQYIEANAPVSARDAEIVQAVAERAAATHTVALNLDCLIAAHEAQEDTKAQQNAWDWLATLSTVTMQGAAYRIPSARWSNTTYLTTATSCTCEARKECWHRRAAVTLDLARENEAIERAARIEWDYWCQMYSYRGPDGFVAGFRQYAPVAACEAALLRDSSALADLLECWA